MSLQRRLSRLEHKRGGKKMIGIRYAAEDLVTVSGKQIPLAEWQRLYPDGSLIHVVYEDTRFNESTTTFKPVRGQNGRHGTGGRY